MQQRQPRLGDILDDYCPRERRLTNHVVVAMIGESVKQTRCTTCESDHEYKHAALPRQKKKSEHSALYSQVLANVSPKRPAPLGALPEDEDVSATDAPAPRIAEPPTRVADTPVEHAAGPDAFDALFDLPEDMDGNRDVPVEEGPAHRRLIRAQLPRHEGQAAVARQAPDFTIRQPNPGRPKRFGARPARSASAFQGGRPGGGGNSSGNGNGNSARGGGGQRPGGRPQGSGGSRPGGGGSRPANRQGGGGRNRSK